MAAEVRKRGDSFESPSSTCSLDKLIHLEDSDDPSSWDLGEFEGERRYGKQGVRNPFMGRRDSEERNVGRCVVGCCADCTALCCCPMTLFHILALLCVKFPASVARRIARRICFAFRKSPKRRRKICSVGSDSGSWTPCSLTPSSSAHEHPYKDFERPYIHGIASLPPPPPSFGQHFWREFDSGHSSFTSP